MSSSQARRLQQHPYHPHDHHHHHPNHPHPLNTTAATTASRGCSPYTPYSPAASKPGSVFAPSATLIPRDYLGNARSDAQNHPGLAPEAPPVRSRPPLQVHPPSSSSPPTRALPERPSVEKLHSFAGPRFHHPRQPTPFHPPPSPAAVPAPTSPYVAYSPYSFSSSSTRSTTPVQTVPAASPTIVSADDRSPKSAASASLSVSVSDRASPPSSSSSLSPNTSTSYTAYKPVQTPAVQSVQPVQSRAASASAMSSQSRSQNPSREQLRKDSAPDTSNGNTDNNSNNNSSVTTSAVAAAANPAIAAAMAEGSRRTVPRTSSIDSAISSISSGSRSQKTIDTSTITPADIANLISKVGSAEAVIIHLLKEKQHAANQNAQLWKLVDKQRTMVFALNKDLERAMKDKERYKMKLKEVQEGSLDRTNVQKSEDGQSPATTLSKHSDDSPRIAQAKSALDNLDRSSPVDPALVRDADSANSTPSSIRRAEQMLLDQERPGSDLSNRTGPSPTSKMSPPLRRPPPAPLKIDQAQRVRPDIEVTSGPSDSDYEYMEADEVPEVDRGRRKTREEDDQQRAQILAQEQAARSQSNKKKAKSIEPPASIQQGQTHGFPGMGLPTSPRAILTGQQPPFSARPSSPPGPKSYLTPVNNEMHSTQMTMPMRSPGIYAGLPNSPRPGDRPPNSPMPRMPFNRRASVATPPMSPRNMFPTPAPAPRSPLPPPPTQQRRMNIPAIDASVRIDSPTFPQQGRQIYRGLVSDQYPDLLLPPHALPSIDVKVSSSRLRPSRNSYLALKPQEEDPVFTLSVISRATRSELWRVEKVIVALPQLDHQIRQISKLPFKLPDRSIFSGHSPAKIDSRRAALNAYFTALLDTPLDEAALLVICQFLTADAIDPRDDETSLLGNSKTAIPLGPDGKPRMEGYLTKRGKNFGGWKSRYFVLHGPELKYYESPGGPHMGTIKIRHAQIGKQSGSQQKNQSPVRGGGGDDDASDNQYRHAFLILEPKKKDSNAHVRHVLCAECDDERDAWVEALLSYVEDDEDDPQGQRKVKESSKDKEKEKTKGIPKKGSRDIMENDDTLRALSYEDVVAQEAPVRGGAASSAKGITKSNSMHDSSSSQAQANATFDQIVPMSPTHRNISAPTNGVKIQDAGAWGNKNPSTVKQKKLSIWGFRGNPAADIANVGRHDSVSSASERKDPVRPVFGLPLVEAVEFCGPRGVEEDTGLPAVVYRCIEYLKAQHAEAEEGIFRLSGSNVIIKGLKERFNVEGDLDFLEGDTYYDVHAVASLFKRYLRELPVTVLTRELHLEFLHVLGEFP